MRNNTAIQVQTNDKNAERGVLGSVLLENDALNRVMKLLAPVDFYTPAHQHIYGEMCGLHEQGKTIDAIALRAGLEKSGLLEKVGGEEYLLSLTEAIPSAASAEYYANLVKEKAIAREIKLAGEDAARGRSFQCSRR